MNLDYVATFNEVISPQNCEDLIAKFKKEDWEDNGVVNIIQKEWEEKMLLGSIFAKAGEVYQEVKSLTYHWPEHYGFEEFKIMAVGENEGNVDVNEYGKARRFLTMIMFLDGGEGGNHIFTDGGKDVLEVPRAAGKLLCYPSNWTFQYRSPGPVDSEQHVVITYLHYL